MMPRRRAAAGARVFVTLLLTALPFATATAQVTGSASVMVDVAGSGSEAGRGQPAAGSEGTEVTETRVRVVVEARRDLGAHWRVNLAGHVDGLVADRSATGASGTTTAAIVRPLDTYVEYLSSHVEVRAGASRLAWGRLDEFQPTDVVNPIDLTRFLLEGRSEARLAVGLVRTRLFVTEATRIEAVVLIIVSSSLNDRCAVGVARGRCHATKVGSQSARDNPAVGQCVDE